MVCEPNKHPEQVLRNHPLASSDISYRERRGVRWGGGMWKSIERGPEVVAKGVELLSSTHSLVSITQ